MTPREKALSMRLNEFEFAEPSYRESNNGVFPHKINVVKWVNFDPPVVYSVDKIGSITVTRYSYVIGSIEWNSQDLTWKFSSAGTTYLEDGTEELNKWILDFCNKYEVVDGELTERKGGDE